MRGARLGAPARARRGRARSWGLADPGAAVGLVPGEFAGAADPPAEGRDFGAGEGSVFATQVLLNNIQVTLVAFAGGLLFGVGTALALVYNGLLLGVVGGLAFGAGNGEAFMRLISSHGPLELSCIVVGGVAGLRLGHALIVPGAADAHAVAAGRGAAERRARARDGAVARALRVPGGARDGAGAAAVVPGRRWGSGWRRVFWGLVVVARARGGARARVAAGCERQQRALREAGSGGWQAQRRVRVARAGNSTFGRYTPNVEIARVYTRNDILAPSPAAVATDPGTHSLNARVDVRRGTSGARPSTTDAYSSARDFARR